MKYFRKLKPLEYLLIIINLLLLFGWIMIDQAFLPHSWQRFMAFFFIAIILFLVIFFVNKPDKPVFLSNTLTAIVLPLLVVTSIIMHVIISHDFTGKSILLWASAVFSIYMAGIIFFLAKHKFLH